MKKTLMALAVGAAFAAPAAHADVTLSGAINMGIEFLDVGEGTAATQSNSVRSGNGGDSLSTFGVASNYSNVTITSVDDLGGGLKLDFAFQLVAPTNNNSDVSNRNSHIGLVGESWGGIWYGTNENIYERYFYSVDPLDGAAGLGGNLSIFGTPGVGNSFGAARGTPAASPGNRSGFYRRDEQVVWYDSPNWSGFTFGAAVGTTYAKDQGAPHDPWMWQVGVKYVGTSMPLQAWGAFANHKDYFGLADITSNVAPTQFTTGAGTSDSNDRAFQLGVGYTLGDIFLFAQYESLEYKINNQDLAFNPDPVTKYSRDAWGIGMKWNLASGYVGAQFLQAMDGDCDNIGGGCNADDTGANLIGVGYYHTMSKQTQLYVVGSWLDNADLAAYKSSGISNAASPVAGDAISGGFAGVGGNIGATQWGIGVGIKHSF